ncbi:tyrosine-type recombinase/integrase [Mycobacterium avium]|uniref:tyrosine-type recombinase/integrase n=1 Tax=Mycobacterium avium TaxID=1764 RepID=UPI0003D1EA85|nr:site-specific integrase [Mycobacterium avium]ETB31468.1 integrase [Mycobacterium avium subsp. hominissuis 10-4249]KDO94757.1 integrase [Mycobacterium avium subsp. hominissuis A5]
MTAKAREKRTFATIRRLPSKRYQVRYTGPDGVRRNAPRTFAARIDAEAWVVAKRREIDAEVWQPDEDKPQPITFAAYATDWLVNRQVAGRPIKARTRRHYQQILDGHLLPWFASKQLAAITGRDVRAWYAATLTDRPTMRAHAYSLLHTIMGTAVTDELIEANPCRIAGAGTAKRARTIRPASIAEIEALTAKMPPRLAPMVTCAAWCALRLGETLELRRRDIDLDAGIIRIRRAVVRVGGHLVVDTPKSTSGVRDVAIPPHLIERFRDHLVNHTAAGPDALLFPSSVDPGRWLQAKALYVDFHRARDEIGRPDLRWHDLRHSGAVLAAATGATLAELMARLGHSTPSAAMRYQHAAQGRDLQIAAALSKLANA